MTRYLVTGGAGFIGSHIVTALLERGDTVRVLDDFSTGRRENLDGLDVDLVEGSIADLDTCHRAMDGVTHVFHEAALPSVPGSIADPVRFNEVNVAGTLHLLVAARDAGVRRFVFASSSAVYGDAPEQPKREDMPCAPMTPYAINKRAGELYLQAFHGLYRLETVALRYFNVFGPRQDPASPYAAVIPIFLRLMRDGKSPTIHGDGEQSRDFTYVGNVVRANLLAADAPPGFGGKILNCATGASVTVNSLVDALHRHSGLDIPPTHGPERPGDIRHSSADITRIRHDLAYTPDIPLDQGLKTTIEWFMNAMAD